MATKVSLNEAATFLGVSKATLRNWDNDGKLTAVRNPLNGYRQYDLDELVSLKKSVQGESAIKKEHLYNESVKNTSTKDIRRVVNKLHNIIRDNDANSNIVTRFDEISKLLFLRLMGGKELFADCNLRENNIAAEKIKDEYSNLIRQAGKQIPSKFCHIMLTDEAINACGKELYNVEIDESNVDIKGLAYEDTIRGTFDKSDNQQFFTPYQIVDFMVDCLKEYLHGKICDPACGTAGFLIKAAKFNHESVIGIEVDERLAWVSTLNLLLHGEEDFNIVCLDKGGSLSEAATLYFNTMDVILTNPPFGSDYTDKTILDRFVLGKNRSSRRRGILFIEQAWNLLQEGGFVAIIIDQGVLNSSTNTDVREYILSHFLIKGIIDLPESAFLPYANVSSSILILQKKAGNVRQGKTFFAKSLNIGRKSNGDDDINYSPSGEEKLNSDLPEILADWYRYLNGNYNMQYSKCYVAEIEEYKNEDKTLRMDYAFHHPVRYESKALINNSRAPLVTLAEICEERNQSYIPAADPDATTIPFTGLANIQAYTGVAKQEMTPAASIKSSVKRYEPGDIIFSKMRPALRKVAVMNMPQGGYVSSECSVFIVRKDESGKPIIDPEILSALLRSDFVFGQIMPCVTGIGRPRINNRDLRKIKIPVPERQIQQKAIQSLSLNQEYVKELKNKAQALQEEADALETKTINDVAIMMAGGL